MASPLLHVGIQLHICRSS